MSNIETTLSDPEAVERYRAFVEAVLRTGVPLSAELRAMLEKHAAALGVHRLDAQQVLATIEPSVVAPVVVPTEAPTSRDAVPMPTDDLGNAVVQVLADTSTSQAAAPATSQPSGAPADAPLQSDTQAQPPATDAARDPLAGWRRHEAQRVAEAASRLLATVGTITDEKSRTQAYIALARAQARAGEPRAAKQTLDRARQGVRLAEMLAQIRATQVEIGDFAGAERTALSMPTEREIAQELRTVALGLERAGQTTDAIHMLGLAREHALQITQDSHSSLSDGGRYHAMCQIADDQIRLGDWKGLNQTIAEIPDDTYPFGMFLCRLFRDTSATSYSVQAHLHELDAVRQRLDRAQTGAQAITAPSARASALKFVAQARAAIGEFDAAEQIAQTIPDNSAKREALQAIGPARLFLVQALAHNGDFDAARQLAQNMPDAADRSAALKAIVIGQLRAGNHGAALTTTWSITNKYHEAVALAHVASAQAQAGETVAAKNTLKEAQVAAEKVVDKPERIDMLRHIASAQLAMGQPAEAKTTLRQAASLAAGLPGDTRFEALRALAAQQIAAADIESTPWIANRWHPTSPHCSAIRRIIAEAWIQAAQFDKAEQVTNALNAEDQTEALRQLAMAQAQAGQFQAALSNIVKTSDAGTKASLLVSLAEMAARAGDFPAARQAADALPAGATPRTDALVAIARAQARAGDLNAARHIARSLETHAAKALILHSIAMQQAESGQEAEARQTLDTAFAVLLQGNIAEQAGNLGTLANQLSTAALPAG